MCRTALARVDVAAQPRDGIERVVEQHEVRSTSSSLSQLDHAVANFLFGARSTNHAAFCPWAQRATGVASACKMQ